MKAMNIIQESNKCVKCGLCLPYCPTFMLTKNENESPRGRIALMHGLASGHLQPTKAVITALDHCLQCGRCEAVCPAGVNYSTLHRETRHALYRSPWYARLQAYLSWACKYMKKHGLNIRILKKLW